MINFLNDFNNVVEKSCKQYSPQYLCIYLYQFCKIYSRMYENCSIKTIDDIPLKSARLFLYESTSIVLKKGLELLGISTLDVM